MDISTYIMLTIIISEKSLEEILPVVNTKASQWLHHPLIK